MDPADPVDDILASFEKRVDASDPKQAKVRCVTAHSCSRARNETARHARRSPQLPDSLASLPSSSVRRRSSWTP